MSGESLLIILVVGLIAGWLAGQVVQGTGFGLIGDLIIGIVGAFIGGWLMPQLGIHLGSGILAAIINATIGALVLLLIIRLVRSGGSWGCGWGGWGRRCACSPSQTWSDVGTVPLGNTRRRRS
jgi:uncharacterized membrane protein YeaQ/YmgE (transglycosylase-associated protein family)